MSEVVELVVEYVLLGTAPEVLATVGEQPVGADMVARPHATWPAERVSAVTDLHSGWTGPDAEAARLTVYRIAPADVLARFGQVLHAAAARRFDRVAVQMYANL
ncbi:hypothetical protein [Promicromonospora umidemergens]|uniref:hypothetical protein n=1 Tax=Promicromonospora umidemergens TaxID=629679 RepID=UPI0020A2550C|nr:hypothetical protein [Promicromonospora umidemergens]